MYCVGFFLYLVYVCISLLNYCIFFQLSFIFCAFLLFLYIYSYFLISLLLRLLFSTFSLSFCSSFPFLYIYFYSWVFSFFRLSYPSSSNQQEVLTLLHIQTAITSLAYYLLARETDLPLPVPPAPPLPLRCSPQHEGCTKASL